MLEKEELGMPSPALDARPDTDAYTTLMVNAYSYIQKGGNEHGALPVSEILAYYQMFEEDMVETKTDFMYLIHQMNQPVLDMVKDNVEKAKK